MWTGLDAFLRMMDRLFLFTACGLLLAMLTINLVNILSRLVFDIGIIWVFPWTGVLFVWVVFVSFFLIYRHSHDISIDLVTRRLPEPAARVAALFVISVIILLMLTLLYQAPKLLPRQVGKLDMVGIQRYWLSVPLYVSAILIILEQIRRAPVDCYEPTC